MIGTKSTILLTSAAASSFTDEKVLESIYIIVTFQTRDKQ